MERFMFAVGQQQTSEQQQKNLKPALSGGFARLRSQGTFPALPALDVVDNELWDHVKETQAFLHVLLTRLIPSRLHW